MAGERLPDSINDLIPNIKQIGKIEKFYTLIILVSMDIFLFNKIDNRIFRELSAQTLRVKNKFC